jgi:hypothetical protein
MTPSARRALTAGAVLVVVAAVLTGRLVLQERSAGQPSAKASVPGPDYRMRMEGLSFHGLHQGQRVLGLSAASFIVRKKRMGFLTFSVAHEAVLENAVIDLYQALQGAASVLDRQVEGPQGKYKEGASGTGDGSGKEHPSFPFLFARETFTGFPVPVASLRAVTASPVQIRFFQGERLLSRIIASSASIDFRQRAVQCLGRVQVIAGAAELTTETLSFFPETGLLRADGPWTLKRAGATRIGKGLTTDVELQKQGHLP